MFTAILFTISAVGFAISGNLPASVAMSGMAAVSWRNVKAK